MVCWLSSPSVMWLRALHHALCTPRHGQLRSERAERRKQPFLTHCPPSAAGYHPDLSTSFLNWTQYLDAV